MEFTFQTIAYGSTFIEETLPSIPKNSGVYRIFDTAGNLIVLDRSSNLYQRLERYFGERSELHKDLDLRNITSRIEYRHTCSPFETTYVLYLERRRYFARTYRKMKTFRYFTLMKIARRQRFPRIYASRQIKSGVEYFGPFVSRAQFTRLKSALERTFKIRPCLYNIRGNDPHPDCMYFQMHTCSRPCNNDIDRPGYFDDVQRAIAFIQGKDDEIEAVLMRRMTELAAAMEFESAEILKRQLEKLRKGRQEMKDSFESVWNFDYLVVLPASSVRRCRIALVRAGAIASFAEFEINLLDQSLALEADRVYGGPATLSKWQYDEFCFVNNYIVSPLKSVELVKWTGPQTVQEVCKKLRSKAMTENQKPPEESAVFPPESV